MKLSDFGSMSYEQAFGGANDWIEGKYCYLAGIGKQLVPEIFETSMPSTEDLLNAIQPFFPETRLKLSNDSISWKIIVWNDYEHLSFSQISEKLKEIGE